MKPTIYRSLILIFALSSAAPSRASDLIVSAAISTKDALTDAGDAFSKISGDHLSFNFLASGPLMKQIEQGAPVDLFVSAARGQMDELEKRGLIDKATRTNVAGNQLVLIMPADTQVDRPNTIDEVADPRFHRIAIGEPASVPAGQYAMESLKDFGLTDKLKDRLKTAINVRQVLDYVERGEVDAGFVYRSDAVQAGAKVSVVVTIPDSSHEPIEYPAAVIEKSAHAGQARAFIEFLKSPPGQAVLIEHGFTAPPPTTRPQSAEGR